MKKNEPLEDSFEFFEDKTAEMERIMRDIGQHIAAIRRTVALLQAQQTRVPTDDDDDDDDE